MDRSRDLFCHAPVIHRGPESDIVVPVHDRVDDPVDARGPTALGARPGGDEEVAPLPDLRQPALPAQAVEDGRHIPQAKGFPSVVGREEVRFPGLELQQQAGLMGTKANSLCDGHGV